MRKLLSLALALGLSTGVFAQNAKINQFKSKLVKKTVQFQTDTEKDVAGIKKSTGSIYQAKTNQVLGLVPIGTSAGVNVGMWRHNVSQAFASGDANFNAYSFVHTGYSGVLSNTYGTSGNGDNLIVADINKTGVNNSGSWQKNFALLNDTLLKSYVINGELRATHNYPTAAIWNDGTGNPNNARVIWVATINPIAIGDASDFAISTWGYYSYGISDMDGSIKYAKDNGALDSSVTASTGMYYLTGFGQRGSTNEFWGANRNRNTAGNSLPTISIFKGTYDPAQDTMDFKVASTVDITSGTVANPKGFGYVFDLNFGFSPDGMTGYTVARENYVSHTNPSWAAADTMASPGMVVWKTTDGGTTWNPMSKFKIDIMQAITNSGVNFSDTTHKYIDPVYAIDSVTGDTTINGYPGLVGAPTMTVDANGTPHIVAVVVPMDWSQTATSGSFSYYPGYAAAYDFYWDSNINDWVAMFLDWYPGVITDYTDIWPNDAAGGDFRTPVFVSRSLDGNLVNFITPRSPYDIGPLNNNDQPHIYSSTYNAATKTYQSDYKGNAWEVTYADDISAGDPFLDGKAFNIKVSPLLTADGRISFAGMHTYNASTGTSDDPIVWGWTDSSKVVVANDKQFENVNNVSIYPNPAQNKVNVKFDLTSASNVTLEVYNMMGQKVATTTKNNVFAANGNTMSLDVSTLNTGMYIVKFNAEGNSYSSRLMITK